MSELPATYNTQAPVPVDPKAVEAALLGADLGGLSAEQRVSLINHVCAKYDLDPLMKPFIIITTKQGGKKLYATHECAEALRAKNELNINIVSREMINDLFIVTVRARLQKRSRPGLEWAGSSGREDESTGIVAVANLKGEDLANAMMKAETKAKWRVTFSILGMGNLIGPDNVEDLPELPTDTVTVSVLERPALEAAIEPEPHIDPTPTRPPSRTALIAQLAKAEQSFEAAGLSYTHTTAQIERMSDADLMGYITTLRERYANRGQAAPVQEALV